MISDENTKELFRFIQTADTSGLPSLKELLKKYDQNYITCDEYFAEIKNNRKVLSIDARSENEFAESSMPFSKNFPVLTNQERHNVGLIYKNYSQTSALWLALQYAGPKTESLKNFLENNKASEKNIYVYCWRGGGRSGYLSAMINELGFKTAIIRGGYKSYRQSVNSFFSQKTFPGNLLELSGLTGCGKTELIQIVSSKLPVIDLELAAKHYSSLLGHIPYEIKNSPPVFNQSAFENNIYSQIILNSSKLKLSHGILPVYIIESESRKIGRFQIPSLIFNALSEAPSVRIISSYENRIKRIVRDYFGNELKGIEPMLNTFKDKEYFFKQQLSNSVFADLINLLNEGRVYEFSEIMIKNYYDKKYKDKGKAPVAEISSDNISEAAEILSAIYKNILQKYSG
jgi:tRNA 2-selenouridine synthase